MPEVLLRVLEDNEVKSLLPGYVLLAGGHPLFLMPQGSALESIEPE